MTGAKGVAQPASILISTVPNIESAQKQHGILEKQLGMSEFLLCAQCESRVRESNALPQIARLVFARYEVDDS